MKSQELHLGVLLHDILRGYMLVLTGIKTIFKSRHIVQSILVQETTRTMKQHQHG